MNNVKKNKYLNPILSGFYPDPSICRNGDDFYLICSSFSYYPGIPIFKSQDLVNWNQIGHTLNRPEQLNLDSLGVSRGIFAPAIRCYKNIFYITCTLVDGGGNFIIHSSDPSGHWSNPVWLPEIEGIDPSLFFDDNGKAYIIYNGDPPNNISLYNGHRAIRICEFDYINMKVVGEGKILVNGGTDIIKKPIWIEGPHIFKKDYYYYLIAAEDGTYENHCEVVFRSKDIYGEYIPYEKNPILTQRHLDAEREFPITSTGHADLVEDKNGNWYSVFLGCRPYKPYNKNFYNTGRETFLTPLKWLNGWPIINPDFDVVQYSYNIPLYLDKKSKIPLNGNFTLRDNFDYNKLQDYWIFLRTVRQNWFSLSENKKCLKINLRPETISGSGNPSFIGRRQQHSKCYASLSLKFNPENNNEKAGLIIFQSEENFYFICKSILDKEHIIELYKSSKNKENNNMELIDHIQLDKNEYDKELFLKIDNNGNLFSFFYSTIENKWKLLKNNIDATFLSTKTAGGFVGCIFGMYATSTGKISKNNVLYNWFEYSGYDEVYEKNKF